MSQILETLSPCAWFHFDNISNICDIDNEIKFKKDFIINVANFRNIMISFKFLINSQNQSLVQQIYVYIYMYIYIYILTIYCTRDIAMEQ
jgi:hypothetical protein